MIETLDLMIDILVEEDLRLMAGKITLAEIDFQVMVDIIPMTEAMLDVVTRLETDPKIGENTLIEINHLISKEAIVEIGLIQMTGIHMTGKTNYIQMTTISRDTRPMTIHIGNMTVAPIL